MFGTSDFKSLNNNNKFKETKINKSETLQTERHALSSVPNFGRHWYLAPLIFFEFRMRVAKLSFAIRRRRRTCDVMFSTANNIRIQIRWDIITNSRTSENFLTAHAREIYKQAQRMHLHIELFWYWRIVKYLRQLLHFKYLLIELSYCHKNSTRRP